jgi:ATP-binding cassette subfamily B protein
MRDYMKDQSESAQPVATFSSIAALIEVARTHGVHLSADQIVREYPLGDAEPPLAFLRQLAERHGLKGRVVQMRWQQLARLGRALPAILRMKNGAAMVIVGYRDSDQVPQLLLQDPLDSAGAVVAVDEPRLTEAWTGEVLLIKRGIGAPDAERPFDLAMLVAEMGKEKRLFRDIGVAAFVLSLFALAPPLLYMIIVDRILVYQRLASLWVLGVGIVFLLVFDTAFGFLKRYMVATVTARIDARLNIFMFNRLIGLPIDFFERTPTGEVTYKIGQIWRIRQFLTGQLFGVALECINLLVLLPVMFILSPTLTFIVLGIAVLMFVTVWCYLRPIGRAYARVIQAETRKGTLLVETIHGIRTVKSLAVEEQKRQDWDSRVAEAVRAQTAFQLLANQPQTILQPLEKLIYASALLVGSYLAIGEGATVYAGSLIAFAMIAGRAVSPFVQVANLLQEFQEVRGAIQQVGAVVNNPPEQAAGVHGARPKITGEILFTDVRFRYPTATSNALDDVSFAIPKGSVIGIMGRSGSGKTTVTRLLQGLNRDYEGLIKIDGVDLREIDLTHLRASIGVVLQDNFLFQGTIRENIMAAHRGATLETVIRAARMAGAEEFIERLPRGYDTFIEEGSTNLSGGQRQRLAIARALLGDPSVLILDEATSALDPDSEAIVNSNLLRIAEGRTMIVISHRLTSLVNCDKILVLERGTLNDAGPHTELMARCDIYRHLWSQQNRHLAAAPANDRSTLAAASHV